MTRPRNVIVTGARAPAAVHLGRLLSGAGIRVIFADSFPARIAVKSKACSAFERLPKPRFDLAAYAAALRQAIQIHAVDLIIPTCEEVFYLAQADLPVPVWAPPLEVLQRVHNKFTFIEWLAEMGVKVPQTILLQSTADVKALEASPESLVCKPVWSRFANHVLIRPTATQLAKIRPTEQEPWVAQTYLAGREISVYATADAGQLTGCSAYVSLFRAGKGAGICFEPETSNGIREWVRHFVSCSKWTGQVSFDLIETDAGSLLPLECNPRTTSGIHFMRAPDEFCQTLFEHVPYPPEFNGLQASRMAMWAYGFPDAIRSGRFEEWKNAMRNASDILDWPDDHGPRRAQLATVLQIARTAFANRISLQEASTFDIEWDGPLKAR